MSKQENGIVNISFSLRVDSLSAEVVDKTKCSQSRLLPNLRSLMEIGHLLHNSTGT